MNSSNLAMAVPAAELSNAQTYIEQLQAYIIAWPLTTPADFETSV